MVVFTRRFVDQSSVHPSPLFPSAANTPRSLGSASFLHPRTVVDPICFPRLSAVCRECLFKVSAGRAYVMPHIPDVDCSTLKSILSVKLPVFVVELSDLRWIKHSSFYPGAVNAPLL